MSATDKSGHENNHNRRVLQQPRLTTADSSQTHKIFIVECKRLSFDRTVGEIGERLEEYAPDYTNKDGEDGPLKKHLNRVAFLKNSRTELARITTIPIDKIKLVSCLVTQDLTAMQYSEGIVAAVDRLVDYENLESLLN